MLGTNSVDVLEYTLPATTSTNTPIQSLGLVMYTYYFYYFLMASLILLVAMIGAIVLTMHKRSEASASKKQFISRQVARRFEDSIGFVGTLR